MTPEPRAVEQEKSRIPASIKEIDVLWITAGLGCDGDTIAMTAATQPTLEEVLLGGIPGIPKVHLHNPFLLMKTARSLWSFSIARPKENSNPSFS
jgi:hydrogenase small subunit